MSKQKDSLLANRVRLLENDKKVVHEELMRLWDGYINMASVIQALLKQEQPEKVEVKTEETDKL